MALHSYRQLRALYAHSLGKFKLSLPLAVDCSFEYAWISMTAPYSAMNVYGIMVALLTLVLILLIVLWRRNSMGPKEHYGPPPGLRRALSPDELGDRGWVDWDPAYEADTASAISHMMLRSA